MTIEQASIFIGLKQLREQLFFVQPLMSNKEQIRFGTPILEECRQALAYFSMAFNSPEHRVDYMDLCIGAFTVLRADIEMCHKHHIIHYPSKKDDKNEKLPGPDAISTQQIELTALLGRIDNDMLKYRQSLSKGKSITDTGNTRPYLE